MVSGVSLFFALVNNLAILVATMVVYGAVTHGPTKFGRYPRQLALGFAFGLFALACMHIKIPVAAGVRVDQRNAVVALSGAFGGPLSALVTGVIAAAYRVYLGEAGVLSGVTGIGLSVAAGTILHRASAPFGTLRRGALSAIGCAVLIVPGFALWGTWREGFHLMLSMILPYGTAIGLAIFLGGTLLDRVDRQREAETTFRRMVAVSPEAIVVLDKIGRIRQFNVTAETYSGISAKLAIGRRLNELDWLEGTAQDTLDQRITASTDREEQALPIELRDRDGERVLEAILVPLLSSSGEPGWMLSVRDVTARKRAEEVRAAYEARILQSKSLEALGRLAGGVAHDFNNMLTVILGTTELVRSQLGQGEILSADLESIHAAATRASQLTAQLLAFGRKQVLEPRVLNLNDAVAALVPLLRRSIPENVELKLDCASATSDVMVDLAQLDQVLVNLVVNARDAMPRGGSIVIATANRNLDEEYCQRYPDVKPGAYVEVSVTDTGEGMPREVLERVFEPFFTTKAHGKGTGLGLASVHGMVQQSGGHVQASSKLGQGSRFRVYLPATTRGEQAPTVEVPSRGPQLTGHVLLVEDSELVRAPILRMLRAIGFDVTQAAGGKEALLVHEASTKPIDLLLTDVIMCDMNGPQLVAELKKRNPRLKVLYMSGYTEEMIGHHGVLATNVNFISKPFTIDGLQAAIARARLSPAELPSSTSR